MASCRQYLDAVALLKEHGFTLARTKKHKVWKHNDGRTWVMPSSPSDVYAWKNNLSELKNFLGVNPPRGRSGKRRPRKTTANKKSPLRIYEETSTVVPRDLASQIKSAQRAQESVALEEIEPGFSENYIEVNFPEAPKTYSTSTNVVTDVKVLVKPVKESFIAVNSYCWWKPWTWNFRRRT